MPTPSNAEEYFKAITLESNLYGYFAALPLIPEQETEWLECKGCVTVDRKTKLPVCISDNDVKTFWSEALSGFANTGGGVLIWGLDARKDATGIDCVQDIALHEDAEKLAERLKELLPHSVDPPVGGVQIKAARKPNGKEGFVVCYIPEGKAKPHRGESANRNYYIRIGTSFVIPPVSLLRNLFYPASSVHLVPCVLIELSTDNVYFRFTFDNRGSLSAHEIFVVLEHEDSVPFLLEAGGSVSKGRTSNRCRFPFEITAPLHPDAEPLIYATLAVRREYLPGKITFSVDIACRDTPRQCWRCWVTPVEIVQKFARFVLQPE